MDTLPFSSIADRWLLAEMCLSCIYAAGRHAASTLLMLLLTPPLRYIEGLLAADVSSLRHMPITPPRHAGHAKKKALAAIFQAARLRPPPRFFASAMLVYHALARLRRVRVTMLYAADARCQRRQRSSADSAVASTLRLPFLFFRLRTPAAAVRGGAGV